MNTIVVWIKPYLTLFNIFTQINVFGVAVRTNALHPHIFSVKELSLMRSFSLMLRKVNLFIKEIRKTE